MIFYIITYALLFCFSIFFLLLRLQKKDINISHLQSLLKSREDELYECKEKIKISEQELLKEKKENILLSSKIDILTQNYQNMKQEMDNKFETLQMKMFENCNKNLKQTFIDYCEHISKNNSKDIEINSSKIQESLVPMAKELALMREKISKTQEECIKECGEIKNHLIIQEKQCDELNKQTKQLSQTLNIPYAKGKWGEIQLRKIIEICGLLSYCDFAEQQTLDSGKRPDLILKLPGNKNLIVDAKSPIKTSENDNQEKLKEQVVNLKKHINNLSNKNYFSNIGSLSFVILFLPQESILPEVMSIDPNIIEWSAEKNIVITTPSTTIALLKSIAMCWSSHNASANSEKMLKICSAMLDDMDMFFQKIIQVKKIIDKLSSTFDSLLKISNKKIIPKLDSINDLYGPSREKNKIQNESILNLQDTIEPFQ